VNVQVEPGVGRLRGDETALTQLLLNLLDNAYKYSRVASGEGRVARGEGRESGVRIEVEARREKRSRLWGRKGETVAIAVRDYGMGIERGERRKIFRRFYRAPGANQGNISGVGLGLALCKHVAKAHKGWIEVASAPGQGSTFTVHLPAEV
jgi:two-component system phosphate regulon sensor histidine kinase PhoR